MKILYNNHFTNIYNYEIKNIWDKKKFNVCNSKIQNNCDFVVIYNKIGWNNIKINGKVILIISEPVTIRLYAKRYLDQFDYIISNFKINNFNHSNYLFPMFIKIKELTFETKINKICIFNTLKYSCNQFLYRSIFFEKLESENMADFYGKNTKNGRANKGEVLQHYKYSVIVENFKNSNYFSEKIIDSILCENLIFYDGATDIFNNDFINKNSIIFIDIKNLDRSMKIIKNAILNDEYSKRINFIRESKKNILSNKNSVNNIINNIINEFQINEIRKTKNRIIYSHKYYILDKIFLELKHFVFEQPRNIFDILCHFIRNYKFYKINHLQHILKHILKHIFIIFLFAMAWINKS